MSKHKKTRQQKIISELRRKLDSSNLTPSRSYSFTSSVPKQKIIPAYTKPYHATQTYFSSDLLKTLALTGAIVITELVFSRIHF